MKQSNIISFFEHAKARKGAGTSSQYGRVSNREKVAARDMIFASKDPSIIYQKLLKREQQQYKISGVDPLMEGDHSSQNSSQVFPSSQNSLSHIINSSESNDTPWMQEMAENRYHPSNPYRNKQMRNFRHTTNWNAPASTHDINQYFDDFKRRAKEKDDREMITTFITLVKECCEDTKAVVNASCNRCEGRVTEGVTVALQKVESVSKKLENMECLFKTKDEYEEKIHALEMRLQEKSIEISKLQQELTEVREQAECRMMEKFTEVFDQGHKNQSEKIEELVSKAGDIHALLNKPKLSTADMWSQYSPRLNQRSCLTEVTNQPTKLVAPTCFPMGTQHYVRDSQHRQPTHNQGLQTVTRVFDNLAVTQPTMKSDCYIATGIPPSFKPASYYGISNQHHFAMKSPMPQRHVAFGNMKKDSPVIAVRPFVQDLRHNLSSARVSNSSATHLVEESSNRSVSNASWETLAKSQQKEWFSRNTRSTRQPEILTQKDPKTHEMPPPKAISLPAKVRRSKRKKTNFTKKGAAKRTRLAESKSACNEKTTIERIGVGNSVTGRKLDHESITNDSRGALSTISDNLRSTPSFTCTGIKRENLSPFLTPLRVGIRGKPRITPRWSAIPDLDLDNTGADGVIFLRRSDNKENMLPSSESDSLDWAGF